MPSEAYDRWFNTTIMPRLRTAVSPITWPIYAEREALRAERKIHLARIEGLEHIGLEQMETINQLNARIAELELLLAECEEQPPTQDYNGDRIQVGWRTWERNGANLVSWVAERKDNLAGVVVFGDLKNLIGGRDALLRIKDMGVAAYPYIRCSVHLRVNPLPDGSFTMIGPSLPFEHAVGQIVEANDAFAYGVDGQIQRHPGGNDVFINPRLIASEHAQAVIDHAWDANLYAGIMADGLATNRIYTMDAGGVDYDRDGIADVESKGWDVVSTDQTGALFVWSDHLQDMDIPVIGNGASEAEIVELTGETGTQRLAYAEMPPTITQSYWTKQLAGCMDEKISQPYYDQGNDYRQGPLVSETFDMHIRTALGWTERGYGGGDLDEPRQYWIGDNLDGISEEQRQWFLAGIALVTGSYIVMDDLPGLWGEWGNAVEPANVNGEVIDWQTFSQNLGDVMIEREFEKRRIMVDMPNKTAHWMAI